MPRDGSGVYTLPSGNPVVTGTLIQSGWANPTMSDIAVQLNNVLTRDGVLGPTLAFKLVDGTVAAPGLTFNSEPGLGLYRLGTGVLAWSSVNATTAILDASVAGATRYTVYPRTGGVGFGGGYSLSNQPYGSANSSNFTLSINDVNVKMTSGQTGAGTELPLKVESPLDQDGQIVMAQGQCRLTFSGGNLVLVPLNGNKITIADKVYKIPAAGVSLAPTGLTVGQSYYIYAIQTAGVLSLEASLTGRSTDSVTGMQIKTGDRTRTLVGYVNVLAGPSFSDTVQRRLVASWFNRKPVLAYSGPTATSTTSTTLTELLAGARIDFINWANEPVQFTCAAQATSAAGSNPISFALGVDSIVAPGNGVESIFQTFTGGAIGGVGSAFAIPLAEGYHYATPIGKVGTGTGNYNQFGCSAIINI